MKVVIGSTAVLVFLSTAIISAQAQMPNLPAGPAVPGSQTALLVGKVASEDGSVLSANINVTLDCVGTQTVQTTTDPHGGFSISVRRSSNSEGTDTDDNHRTSSADLAGCEIKANLAGYAAEPLHIVATGTSIGVINVGTILLHPTTQAQAFAVSMNSLAAPEKAKAAFEKGEQQKNKGKWAAAVESFQKAIAAYPRYALAWLELGRVQATENNFTGAKASFRQSVTQDSKLMDGYIELARLAAQQSQWHDLLSATEHLVQVHPEVAEFWFWNSAASFNLGDTNNAQSSIARALRLDSAHRIPQMEYLYALVLARLRNFQAAADHLSAYLRFFPKAPDAVEAQRELMQLQKMAASAPAK